MLLVFGFCFFHFIIVVVVFDTILRFSWILISSLVCGCFLLFLLLFRIQSVRFTKGFAYNNTNEGGGPNGHYFDTGKGHSFYNNYDKGYSFHENQNLLLLVSCFLSHCGLWGLPLLFLCCIDCSTVEFFHRNCLRRLDSIHWQLCLLLAALSTELSSFPLVLSKFIRCDFSSWYNSFVDFIGFRLFLSSFFWYVLSKKFVELYRCGLNRQWPFEIMSHDGFHLWNLPLRLWRSRNVWMLRYLHDPPLDSSLGFESQAFLSTRIDPFLCYLDPSHEVVKWNFNLRQQF